MKVLWVLVATMQFDGHPPETYLIYTFRSEAACRDTAERANIANKQVGMTSIAKCQPAPTARF
jgi:hypothetical protein